MEVLDEIESVDTIDSTPHVGMEFDTLDEAWNFWVNYGGKIGFNTRKDFKNQKKDGPITSRGFVCSNEGYRMNDKRNREVKRPRAETRTGCPVRFSLKLIRQTQKYQVNDFYGEHNHVLQRREAVGLMPSQRKILEPHGVTYMHKASNSYCNLAAQVDHKEQSHTITNLLMNSPNQLLTLPSNIFEDTTFSQDSCFKENTNGC